MRFESLTAHGFGPLRGRTVTFAPGINVLYGANESGKSTLHAALFAGLCGVRRGRGAARKDDQEFADRHRPWDGAPWSVSTVVVLADGRRIELQQDLDGKVACRAIDLTLGVDCSAEIMHEGTPDGSLWLGFNRRTFLATACVRQAAVLGVCGEAEQLQEQLQRATATAGADGTVAEAIARIEQFRAAHVGRDWSTSVRPLRRAMNRVEAQRQALDDARRAYGRYLALAAELESLEEQAAADERRCQELRTGLAMQQAEVLEGRLRRARELWASFPDGEPPGLVGEDELPQDMAAALRAWEEGREAPGLARGAPGAPPRLGRWVWLGLGAVLAIAGVAVLWRAATIPGLLLLAAGLALGAGALWRAGSAHGSSGAAPPEEGGDLASTLRAWQQRRREALLEAEAARRAWAELQALLGGMTLAELEAAAGRARAAGAGAAPGGPVPAEVAAELAALEGAARASAAAVARARGQLEERERTLANVAELEESLAAAEAELSRIRRLEETLELTQCFLERAQERVHRDVAPVLADAVGRRLPALTGGRYTHVLVDPRTLDVQVREQGGAWRRAALLSHGAAEQVYLLLRLALTEHLTRPGEVCPLILDDVLVQSDAQRKAALLRVLEEAGQQRQVILFTQEDTVFAWARTHLTAPVHRVQRLDAAAAAADRFQRMAAAVSS